MKLIFVILEGPRAGDVFKVTENLTIGRSKGDVTLRDPKVSSSHAKVELNADKTLELIDLGSVNGLVYEGQRRDRLLLVPGLRFKVGDTLIEVLEERQLEIPESERDTWQGQLWSYFKSLANLALPAPKIAARAFRDPLGIQFVEGPQAGTLWWIGYGPRTVGAASNDLPILDPAALDVCFELLPTDKGPVFQTERSDKVLLNGKPIEKASLHVGDKISFGDNLLEIIDKTKAL